MPKFVKGNTNKKLLVTASTFPRWENDTEPRFVLDLSVKLTQYFDVTVLVPATTGAKTYEVLEGVEVIRYHYFPIHRFETLCYPGAIMPRIKEKKVRILLVPFLFISLYFNLWRKLPSYDVVHAHWLIPQGIIQSFFKTPYVVTGHGGDVTSLNSGIVKKLKIRCLEKARHVTVVSQHLSNEVQKICGERNVDLISMGCNIDNFGKQYYQSNYFGQGNKKIILFVGRLAEKKGVTYLIKAMHSVDAVLVVVGDGPLKEGLMEQAKELHSKVLFLGSKTHNQLKDIYASADIFVAPSITAKDGDQEGLPTTIMEAMASQIPVIASRTGGISSLIENNRNGFLCDEKNVHQLIEGINRLLQDKKLYAEFVKESYEKIKKYDYTVLGKKYAALLK